MNKNIILIIGTLLIIGTVITLLSKNAKQEVSVVEVQSKTEVNEEDIRTVILAGGCFWCVEADMQKLAGVVDVVSGYSGGQSESPTYQNYTAGGHREVVEVEYDSSVVDLGTVIEYFLKHIDPTDSAGSFGDRGVEYSPAIYYADETEKEIAENSIQDIEKLGVYDKPLSIPVLQREKFWPAEEYHQDYSVKNPVRYKFYRTGSGRDVFLEKYWGI